MIVNESISKRCQQSFMKFVGLTCKRLSRHRRLVVYYIKKLLSDFMGPYGVMWDTLLRLREAHNFFAMSCVLLLFLLLLDLLPALSGISGNSEQKIILQTIEQLIQYTVLGIHFRSLKQTTVIRICKNLSNFLFLSKRYKAVTVC